MIVTAGLLLFLPGKRVVAALRDMSLQGALLSIQRPAGYVAGTLATFWTLDRVSQFWV